MIWICAGNNNTKIFSLLLSSAYAEASLFLLLLPYHKCEGWGCTSIWEGTQLWGKLTQFYTMCHHKCWGKLGEEEEDRRHFEWWCLSSPVTIMCKQALISGDGRTPACPWKWWMISLFGLACVNLLLYLFKCLYLTHEFSHFYLSNSLPHPSGGGVSKWLRVAWSSDGLKPQRRCKMFRKMLWVFISFAYLWKETGRF